MIYMGDTEDDSYDLSSVPYAYWWGIGTSILSDGSTWWETNMRPSSFVLDAAGS